jgi:hypothetical protein
LKYYTYNYANLILSKDVAFHPLPYGRGIPGEKLKRRKANRAPRCLRQPETNYNEYNLHDYVGRLRNACWIGDHIDSLTAQKIATRAFQAVSDYEFAIMARPGSSAVAGRHHLKAKTMYPEYGGAMIMSRVWT